MDIFVQNVSLGYRVSVDGRNWLDVVCPIAPGCNRYHALADEQHDDRDTAERGSDVERFSVERERDQRGNRPGGYGQDQRGNMPDFGG